MEHRGSQPVPPAARRRTRLGARLRAWGAVTTVVAMTVTGLVVGAAAAPVASAAPGPVRTTEADSVTAAPLPTVQINGVVWSQAVVGNKVFAGGNFTSARPAGAAAGTGETPRSYLLAYDLTTGVLDSGFAPVLNGQVRTIVASPDGSRVYVGGDFTTVNGASRSRIVAFDTATGAVITNFLAAVDYNVYSIAPTDTTVYVAGDFNSARGVARKKLAAFNVADGALLGWNPGADARVNAIVLAPDKSKVVIGGAFQNAAGAANYGMAAINATTGASMTWNVGKVVRNAGKDAAILYLTTDGTAIYGNGYVYGAGGNLEGAFSANPANGDINWIEDCHGDTYGLYAPVNASEVYTVGHAHFCGNVGGFPQTNPWTYQRGMSFTKAATGTLNTETLGYYNFGGNPSPSIVSWFPELAMGSFTKQYQAAWTVTGNSQYVVLGGEFPRVNGVAQQGLVRFAVQPISKGTAPVYSGANLVPSIAKSANGIRATLSAANWDRDDSVLTYQLLRDGKVVNSTAANSTFWSRPSVVISDTGLTAGTTYKYQIRTVDSAGNTATGNQVSYTATATSAAPSAYAQLISSQNPSSYWRLGEASGTTYDWSGSNDGTLGSGVTRGVAGAIVGDGDTAVTFNGTDSGRMSTKTSMVGPNLFSQSMWIKTTTTSGGKILGFATAQTGTSGSNYDRHVYMDNAGKIYFGVFPNAVKTVNSSASYNDGQWHQVVATLGPAGMALYVDGALVGQDATVTTGQAYSGYWRLGGDNLDAWTNKPTSRNFNGSVDEVAIYPTVLTAQQVKDQYQASGQAPNANPTAAFTSTPTNLAVAFDGSGSSDPDGSVASYAWNFGDNSTGTGAKPSHTYAASGTYQVTLTVTDNRGGTNAITKPVTVTANKVPTAQFTVTANNLALSVDGSTSTDPDGTIASYAWDFGDNSTGTGVAAAHTYAAAGTYPVKLTVTDNAGGTNTLTQQVTVSNPPVNKVPVASFTTNATGLSVSVDGTASNDPDGTIASYTWDFGDGTNGSGVTASRTYASGGTYTVKLTVTDDKGATGQTSKTVTVTGPPPQNQVPVAAFTATPSHLAVAFDASTSSDPDGTVASYAWDFGDGQTGTGRTPSHTYGSAGKYTVKLTVTDNKGATGDTTSEVTVTAAPPNQAPTAAFTSLVTNLAVAFDGSGSADPDGTIASYAWDFGDGTTGSGAKPSHTYGTADTYQVTLTVTDNGGTTTSITHPVTIAQGPNQVPTAAFTSSVNNLAATFDAGTSKDPDGSITTYAWDFGDGQSGTGVNPSHTYAGAGTYQVKLTVTDNSNASSSVTNPVTVATPPPAVFASDEFGRTVAAGWGTADQGGAWTVDGNTASFKTNGSAGMITMATAGSGKSAWMNAVSQADVDTTVDVKLDKAPTGGGATASVAAHRVGTSDYRLRVRLLAGGAVSAELTKVVNGTETALATQRVAGLTYNAGDTLRLRFQTSGTSPTTLQGKVWKVGTTEPSTWQVSKTDSTAGLQAAGGIGIVTYVSGSATNAPLTMSFDNLTVSALQ